MKTINDYKIGQIVYASWFGDSIKMKVIGFHKPTRQMQVQHLEAPGSFYQTSAQEMRARKHHHKSKIKSTNMKKTTLHKLKDGQIFKLNTRKGSGTYKLDRIDKKTKEATITSQTSRRTYLKPWTTACFIVE